MSPKLDPNSLLVRLGIDLVAMLPCGVTLRTTQWLRDMISAGGLS